MHCEPTCSPPSLSSLALRFAPTVLLSAPITHLLVFSRSTVSPDAPRVFLRPVSLRLVERNVSTPRKAKNLAFTHHCEWASAFLTQTLRPPTGASASSSSRLVRLKFAHPMRAVFSVRVVLIRFPKFIIELVGSFRQRCRRCTVFEIVEWETRDLQFGSF